MKALVAVLGIFAAYYALKNPPQAAVFIHGAWHGVAAGAQALSRLVNSLAA